MTLENPNILERAWNILKMKPVYIGICCLVGLGILLYALQGIQSCSFNRSVKKDKQAIANQVQEISNTQAEIANLKVKAVEQAANLAAATQKLLDDQNASQAAREATNQALANMNAAVNANRSVDVSGIDLQRKLEELDW